MSAKGPAVVTKRPAPVVPQKSRAAAPSVKLGAMPSPVGAHDHGKLCECVDCVQTHFKKHREITPPETCCRKYVRIHVDIECESTRQVIDKWSYQLDGEKCEEIDPEPSPCDPIEPCDNDDDQN